MKTLVLGGVRSGKSRYAEKLALESRLAVTYVATATAQDAEMRTRIAQHQQCRSKDWGVIEEPIALARVVQQQAAVDRCIIVDCLTLWLTNILMAGDAVLKRERAALLTILPALPGSIILVANETSLGVIPLGELTRRFIDEAGILHQQIAALSECVVFTVAGLPLTLKGALV